MCPPARARISITSGVPGELGEQMMREKTKGDAKYRELGSKAALSSTQASSKERLEPG